MVEKYEDGEIIESSLENHHIFHETHRDSLDSILSNGFNPKFDRAKENDEKYVEAVADKIGVEYPVDRVNASFFYPTLDLTKQRSSYRGYVVVVDATKLSYPVYVGDVELYDEIFDNAPYMDSLDELDDSQIDLGKRYLNSLEKVQSYREISSVARSFSVPEVIVDTTITSDAVVGYIKV